MTTVRIEKHANFTVVPNALIYDRRLAPDTRLQMVYLLSKPDNWEVRLHDITANCGVGEHRARRMLRELTQFGYLRRTRTRRPDGTFMWHTVIAEQPDQPEIPSMQDTMDAMDEAATRRLSTSGPSKSGSSTIGSSMSGSATRSASPYPTSMPGPRLWAGEHPASLARCLPMPGAIMAQSRKAAMPCSPADSLSMSGPATNGLSMYGSSTTGQARSGLSTCGLSTRGPSTRGKVPDVLSTELTKTDRIKIESAKTEPASSERAKIKMPGSEQAKAASSSGQTSTAPAKSDTPSGEPAQAQPASTGPARSETERTLLPAFYLKSAPAQTVTARESAQVPSPEVLEAFELNMPPLSPSGLALLAQLEHSYSSAWVLDAIREAEDLYPTGELRHPLGYLRKILARWKLDGHQARVVRGSTPDADDGPSRVESQIARFLADRPARRPSRGRDRGESHDAASFADTAIMSAAEVRSQMAELGSPR